MAESQKFIGNMKWWNAAESISDVPSDLVVAKELYQVDKEGNIDQIISLIQPHVTALFLVEELFDYDEYFEIEDPDNVECSSIKVVGVEFDDGVLPRLKTEATFDLPLKSDVDKDALSEFLEENEDSLPDCLTMMWTIENEDDADLTFGDHGGVAMMALA